MRTFAEAKCRMRTSTRIFLYAGLVPLSFLLVATAWLVVAPGHLYHCWDDAPPFAISWYPPFIHSQFDSLDGNLRDYYIWPEWAVYSVWFAFVAIAFLLPGVAV